MTKESQAKLTLTLAIIAAVLAVAVVIIQYLRNGEFNFYLIGAALLLVALGWGRKKPNNVWQINLGK